MRSVEKVPPGHFIEQFMKDLINKDITNLTQIRWRFNGDKALANFRENMMKAIDKLPLTDNLAEKFINGRNKDMTMANKEMLDKFENKLAITSNTEFVNFKNIIGKLTDNNPQNSQAAHWIIQDLTNNMGDFAGKKWNIEFPVRNSDGNASFIDVASNSTPPKFIEYKWLTSATVGKEDFIREFIKRDLFNSSITNPSQLEWRIKGQKLTKDKVVEYLKSTDGREALKKISAEKANLMLNRTDLQNMTEIQKNRIADAFIEYFDNQSNFNKIFK